ncbi:MAG: hypothetical protein LIP23_01865 [Planctomycetes bacterium]|nr:hypothetical protein [Planctomycetota bacterium]
MTGSVLLAADAMPDPMPLPPPPELLNDLPFTANEMLGGTGGEAGNTGYFPGTAPIPDDVRQKALEPPQRVTVAPPPPVQPAAPAQRYADVSQPPLQPVAPNQTQYLGQPVAAQAAGPVATGRMVISPPSMFMPDDYFNLPVDEDGIPGVILPELDEEFYDPSFQSGTAYWPPASRPVEQGMSVRQLSPYFSLAKGLEGEALSSRQRGDENAFADQLRKAVDAYMEIVSMADAGNEAREEAWYGVARCEYRLGNWWRAFDALERSFPRQFDRNEVAGRIKLEMFIGERLWRMAANPVPDASQDGQPLTGYQAASRVYAAAVFNQPSAEDAPLALLRRGDAASLEADWKNAATYYRQVVEYFPESEPAMQARSSLTEAIYRQEWPAGFPEAAREDVASIMDDVERANAELTEEAEERRVRAVAVANNLEAENKLRHAKEYLRALRVRKSRDAAVFLLGDIVSLYPGTEQAGEASEILRGMGIEPPVALTDGDRFPLTAGWSGAEQQPADTEAAAQLASDMITPGFSGGTVALEGQVTSQSIVWPPPPPKAVSTN